MAVLLEPLWDVDRTRQHVPTAQLSAYRLDPNGAKTALMRSPARKRRPPDERDKYCLSLYSALWAYSSFGRMQGEVKRRQGRQRVFRVVIHGIFASTARSGRLMIVLMCHGGLLRRYHSTLDVHYPPSPTATPRLHPRWTDLVLLEVAAETVRGQADPLRCEALRINAASTRHAGVHRTCPNVDEGGQSLLHISVSLRAAIGMQASETHRSGSNGSSVIGSPCLRSGTARVADSLSS